MNVMSRNSKSHAALLLIMLLSLALAACGPSRPPESPEVARLQTELDRLRSNAELASRAQDEIRQAESALNEARNLPRRASPIVVNDALYIAERRIQIADAEARARYADHLAAELSRERERLMTEARTLEADRARRMAAEERMQADRARAEAEAERMAAERARSEAERARREAEEGTMLARQAGAEAEAAMRRAEAERLAAEAARAEAEAARRELEEMRQKLAELEARPTPRGLLLTLGDVLFELNQAELKEGVARNLQPLVEVLQGDQTRNLIIEGHTDSTGSREYNMGLSQRRAESVRNYLVNAGIDASRMSVAGLGPDFPVASNDSAAGRQQNRRVEVIISDADRQ